MELFQSLDFAIGVEFDDGDTVESVNGPAAVVPEVPLADAGVFDVEKLLDITL